MADRLGILILLLVIVTVIFVVRRNAVLREVEGFGEFKDSQMAFGDYQNTYFHDKANKGILTNPGLNLAGLNEAVAQPDLYLAKSPTDDMTRFFMEDPENAFKDEDNKMCRGATHPRDLPIRKPGDRLGCGWYFKDAEGSMSMGALGTREGPVIPTGLRGGTWIWNREEAVKLEDMKRCKTLKNCEMLAFGDIGRECGFCFEKGHGIPITSTGKAKYPKDAAGICGSKVVTRAENCSLPGGGRGGGRGGASAAPREGAAGANWCINNGIVSVPCLLQQIQWFGFDPVKGGLGRLISGNPANAMTLSALAKLAESGLALPETYWKSRTLAVITRSANTIRQIATLSRRITGNDARAARFLVDGTPYTPCDSYTAGQTGPFEVECLQQAFRKAGCQAGGAKYPNPRSAVSELANVTWSQANAMFKKTHDDMKSSDPRTQDMALKNCLGVGAEFSRTLGETCWKCEDGINVPIRRNAAGELECASTDGYNCLWQASKGACDAVIANMPPLRPLGCGDDHRRKYGSDGYSNPQHWCAKASTGGKHDGSIAKSWIDVAVAGKWIMMAGALSTITIGNDNAIWGTNASNLIFRCSGPSGSPDWVQIPGGGNQVDCKSRDSAVLVGTDRQPGGNGLYMWNRTNWRKVPGGGTWMSIGSDGTTYVVNNDGVVYLWNGSNWNPVASGYTQITVANKDIVYAVGKNGRPYRKNGNSWTEMPGGLTRISVSGDGSKVVGINREGAIFAWDGTKWRAIPGSLINISVNNNYIVGTNSRGEIFYLALA